MLAAKALVCSAAPRVRSLIHKRDRSALQSNDLSHSSLPIRASTFRCSRCAMSSSDSVISVSGFETLIRVGEDLRAFDVRACRLQGTQTHHFAGMSGVVHRRVAQFSLGFGVDRVAHTIFALTRPNASSPATIATLPFRISSHRRRAKFIQAFCAFDFGLKLAIRNSRIRARSSARSARTSAARSLAGVVMMPPGWCLTQGCHSAKVRTSPPFGRTQWVTAGVFLQWHKKA